MKQISIVTILVLFLFGVINHSAAGQDVEAEYLTGLQLQNQGNSSNMELSLSKLLSLIETEYSVSFVYEDQYLEEKFVSVNNLNSAILSEDLGQLLVDLGFAYTKKGTRTYVLRPNNFSESLSELSNQNTVIGRVTDTETGESLPGVNVLVEGTEIGTVTDLDGKYELNIPSADVSLVFSYIGYQRVVVEVDGRDVIDIQLNIDIAMLDDIVVIGYGTVQRSDLTGSVGSMKAEEVAKQPVVRVDQALQGRVSGVQVSSIGGAPGSGTTVRIRGGNSINASNEPLFVIDGFIGGGDLNTINPSDIESIEVLKDASATAIYGSRGANGVILITTKRGARERGFGASFNTFVGFQSPVGRLDLLNGPEFAEYRNEYAEFLGNAPPFPNVNEVANTDWQDVLFRNVPISDQTLTIFNNSENSNYYVSLNYLNQDGIQLGSGFNRAQLRFNFDQNLGNIFKTGASVNTSFTSRENPRAAAISLFVIPTSPIYLEDGSFHRVEPINGSTYNNPVAQDRLIRNDTDRKRALGNLYLEITPIEGLLARSTFGFDLTDEKRTTYNSVDLPTNFEAARGGQASINTPLSTSIQSENTINYTNTIGIHNFGILGGWTYQNFSSEALNVSARGFSNDVTVYSAIQTGDPEALRASSGETKWSLMSGLYRLNYSYAGKYLFTFSGRHDGSSRLAENNKWQFFPAAAIAWRLSEESFIDELGIFSDLKLRASYGKTGNQSIAPYSSLARLNSGLNYIGGQQVTTFLPSRPANASLKWEVTEQYDIGLEAGFLNDRISIEFDYYYKKTSDLLLARELAFQTGHTSRLENVGSLQNQGFDITISAFIISTENLTWSSDLNVSSNRSEILDLGGNEFLENGGGSRLIVGQPVGTFFGARYLGLWQEGDPGLGGINVPGAMKFEDLNGDGIITAEDGQIIGRGTPDFYGGFNNVVSYRNFTLSVFFDFSYGNDIYDLDGRNFNTGHATNVYGQFRDRWTPTNTDTDVPRAGAQVMGYFNSYPGGNSSYDVHDGSYLRLKNLNLEYQIPVETSLFRSMSVYGTATNLFTLTNYEGYSPDVSAAGTHPTRRGFDSNLYPPAKTLLAGIKIEF